MVINLLRLYKSTGPPYLVPGTAWLGYHIMKKNILNLIIAIICGTSTIVITGCAGNQIDTADSGLSLGQHTTGKVYIAWSDAYEDGDGFVVTGALKRRDTIGLPIKAHVTIQSTDGTIINETRSSDIYVPRRITGRGQCLQRFRVRFPSIPAEGSKVSLVAHSGSHNNIEKTVKRPQ